MNLKSLIIILLVWLPSVLLGANQTGKPTVLVWGDSLSSAYGIPIEQGWVAMLQSILKNRGVSLVNGSINGETTKGGLSRLPAALIKHRPALVILELGGNDGLRGISINELEKNLVKMAQLMRQAGAEVLILAMKIPPNYGPYYTQRFSATFESAAKQTGSERVPFFLEGIATDYELMQPDGIHPNVKAQSKMLENVWPAIERKLLQLGL